MRAITSVFWGIVVGAGPAFWAGRSLDAIWLALALVAGAGCWWAVYSEISLSFDHTGGYWVWCAREGGPVLRPWAPGVYWALALGQWAGVAWLVRILWSAGHPLWMRALIAVGAGLVQGLACRRRRDWREQAGLALGLAFLLGIPWAWPNAVKMVWTPWAVWPAVILGAATGLSVVADDRFSLYGWRWLGVSAGLAAGIGAAWGFAWSPEASSGVLFDGMAVAFGAAGVTLGRPPSGVWPRGFSRGTVLPALAVLILSFLPGVVLTGAMGLGFTLHWMWPVGLQRSLRRRRPALYRPWPACSGLAGVGLALIGAGWLILMTAAGGAAPMVAWGLWLTAATLIWATAHDMGPFAGPRREIVDKEKDGDNNLWPDV